MSYYTLDLNLQYSVLSLLPPSLPPPSLSLSLSFSSTHNFSFLYIYICKICPTISIFLRKLYKMLMMPVLLRSNSIWIAVLNKHSHLHYYQLHMPLGMTQTRMNCYNNSLDLLSFHITMHLSRKKTGKVYKAFNRVVKPRIHTKSESLELDLILSITLLVRECYRKKGWTAFKKIERERERENEILMSTILGIVFLYIHDLSVIHE